MENCYAAIVNTHREVQFLILDPPEVVGRAVQPRPVDSQVYVYGGHTLPCCPQEVLSRLREIPACAPKHAVAELLQPLKPQLIPDLAHLRDLTTFPRTPQLPDAATRIAGPSRALFEKCQSSVALEGLPRHVGSHAHSLRLTLGLEVWTLS